jgi:hypothetical protein
MEQQTVDRPVTAAQATPVRDLPRVLAPTAKAAGRHGWRLRRQLSPLATMVATWVAGCVLRLSGMSWWMVLAAGAAAAVFGAAQRWWLNRRAERFYTAAVLTAITLWLTAVCTQGLGSPMPAWLAGVGGVLAMPWWWHYRLRGVPKPEPEQVDPAEDPRITEWAATVARPGGPLTDSRLLETEDIRGGWAGTIEILRGNTDRAVMATKDIGAALKLKAGSIFIEPTDQGELYLARILVLPDNPLAKRIDWPGPTLDTSTGVSVLGQYADGEPVNYRHYRPGSGPVHDLISGCTDSGKSRTVEQLLAEERHSGVIVSHLIDGKRGTSLPDWAESVDEYATSLEEARDLLTKDRNRMYLRIAILKTCGWVDDQGRSRKGLSQFDPGDPRHGLPMLSITIDEAQNILSDDMCRSRVEEMIGMSRSCGIKFRLITQVPLLPQLGNSMVIRDAVAAGNVIILRTANRLTGQVAFNGALPVDPCSLPKEWPDGSTTSGLGFVFAPGADRPSAMRVGYVEDPFGWAISGTPALIELSDGEPFGDAVAEMDSQPVDVPDDSDAQRVGEEAVLAYLADRHGQDVGRGEMFSDIQATVSPPPALRTLTKAITDLTSAGQIERAGRGVYRITEIGIADARRRQLVA